MGGTWEKKWEIGIQVVRGLSDRVDGLVDVPLQGRVDVLTREPLASHSPVDFLLNSWCQEPTFLLSQDMEDSLDQYMTRTWEKPQSLAHFREMSPGGREKFIRGKLAKCCGEFRMLQELCSLIQEPPRELRRKKRRPNGRERRKRYNAKQLASSTSAAAEPAPDLPIATEGRWRAREPSEVIGVNEADFLRDSLLDTAFCYADPQNIIKVAEKQQKRIRESLQILIDL